MVSIDQPPPPFPAGSNDSTFTSAVHAAKMLKFLYSADRFEALPALARGLRYQYHDWRGLRHQYGERGSAAELMDPVTYDGFDTISSNGEARWSINMDVCRVISQPSMLHVA
jgi:hypothetical protein